MTEQQFKIKIQSLGEVHLNQTSVRFDGNVLARIDPEKRIWVTEENVTVISEQKIYFADSRDGWVTPPGFSRIPAGTTLEIRTDIPPEAWPQTSGYFRRLTRNRGSNK